MKITTASLGTAILAIFVMGAAAGQEAEEHLSNADIVTLVEAGLTASAIVALIESRGTEFDTSVAQLAALSRAGVDSAVVEGDDPCVGVGRFAGRAALKRVRLRHRPRAVERQRLPNRARRPHRHDNRARRFPTH